MMGHGIPARRTLLLAAALLCVSYGSALAWKPKTHIYLADRALRSVQPNRTIAIYGVNHETGQVLEKVGDYEVDSALVAGIQANRKIFNAGVLGPDAYPDIVTGQTIIHPDVARDEGSNTWLEHLWNKSRSGGAKEKAFVAGYLFHAAGDMYAHTYMNHYAGGDFAIGANAIRHVVLEGYIGTKTPVIPAKEFSIRSSSSDNTVRDFIYENMIKAPIATGIEDRLLVTSTDSKGSFVSIPLLYSALRNYLAQVSTELGGSHGANDPLASIKRAYINAWIDDIDSGLKAWPMVSEKLAGLLVYPVDESLSQAEMKEQIRATCEDYVNQHLLSMSGLPDIVGQTRAQAQAIIDDLLAPLGPIKDKIDEVKDDFTNAMVKAATGYTLDEITTYLKQPELRFDPVLGPSAPRDATSTGAASITRSSFDANQLQREANGEWKLESFPPAYNTVLMTQLILLKKSEVNRLINDLKAAASPVRVASMRPDVNLTLKSVPFNMTEPNVMLGFQRKLDGSNQWHQNGSSQQMALVRAGVYDQVFMKQTGEDDDIVTPPAPLPSGTVKVTITHVSSVDDVDPAPGQGQADFYGWIQVDDRFKSFATIEGANTPSPNWTLSNEVVANTVPIKIRLFDEDTGLTAPDDLCDIDPHSGKKTLDLTYDLRTGKISGDATGNKGTVITVRGAGDGDRCEISFKVEGP